MIKINQILLFYFLVIRATTAELSLTIIKNKDGLKTSVSSLLIINSGTNFTLTCKIVDTENGNQLYYKIVWGKKKQIKLGGNKATNGTNLTFTSITINDEGVYFCSSPKYKLLKAMFLIVNPELSYLEFERKTLNLKYHMDNYYAPKGIRNLKKKRRSTWLDELKEEEKQRRKHLELQRQDAEYRREREMREAEERRAIKNKNTYITVGVVIGVLAIIIVIYILSQRMKIKEDTPESDNCIGEIRRLDDTTRCNDDVIANTQIQISNAENNTDGQELLPPSYEEAVADAATASAPPPNIDYAHL